MLFAADQNKLLKVLNDVSCASKKGTDYPELAGVLIQADISSGQVVFSCTDTNTFLQKRITDARIKEAGTVLLNAQLLKKIVEMAEQNIVIAGDEKNIAVIFGQTRFDLQALPSKKFPMPQITYPDQTIQVSGLRSLIYRSIFAVSQKKEDNSILESVRFTFNKETGSARAADHAAFVIADLPLCSDGELDIILHQDPLSILYSISNNNDRYYIGVSSGKAVIMNDQTLFVTKLMNGDFLNTEQLIQKFQPKSRALTDAKELYRAIDRCMISVQDNTDYSIHVIIGDRFIALETATCYGMVKDKISAADTASQSPDGFHYNPDKMISFLKNASGPLELLMDKQGCMLMKANNSVYFLAPRRQANIRKKKADSAKAAGHKKNESTAEQLQIAA